MEEKVTTWELASGKPGLRYLPRAKTSQSQKMFLQNELAHFWVLRILKGAYIQCGREGTIVLNTELDSARLSHDVLERVIFKIFF